MLTNHNIKGTKTTIWSALSNLFNIDNGELVLGVARGAIDELLEHLRLLGPSVFL